MPSMRISVLRFLRTGKMIGAQMMFALLAVLVLLGCAAGAHAQEDPVAVRVGKVAYPLSEVQAYLDSIADMASELYGSVSQEDIGQYKDTVVESYVSMGIMENKYVEFGLDRMTAEDQAALEQDAKLIFEDKRDEYAQSIAEEYGKTQEEARQYAPTFMELNGYTMDTAREEALQALKEERILAYVTADIPEPSEADVADYYQENFVAPSQDAYANDIEAFETNVLYYGDVSAYIPDGYRYVRHILLPADPEAKTRAEAQEVELAELEDQLTTAFNSLYGHQALGEDTTAAQQTYDKLLVDRQAKQTQLQATLDEALTLHADELTEIYARLNAGESFDALMAEYSQDTQMPQEGYMVCADSILWTTTFRDAAMALTKIGEVGEPITTTAGVHILEYTADAPAGAVALEGAMKEQVTALALRARQYEVLKGYLLQWREEYDIETHPELLSLPEGSQP